MVYNYGMYKILIFLMFTTFSYSSPLTVNSSRSIFFGETGLVLWKVGVGEFNNRGSNCLKTNNVSRINKMIMGIAYPCSESELFEQWLNENKKYNYYKLIELMELVEQFVKYLFGNNSNLKLTLILTSEKSKFHKKIINFSYKRIPITVIGQFNSQNEKFSSKELASIFATIIHETAHIYFRKHRKAKLKTISAQSEEAIAEISSICAALILGNTQLEPYFSPKFKTAYLSGKTATVALNKTKFITKFTKRMGERYYNHALGYVKGRYKLWNRFGTFIQNKDESKNIYKFCKYIIYKMPDVDLMDEIPEKEYLQLESFQP